MAITVPLSCSCCAFKARVVEAPAARCNHGICYCVDCQAGARHLGKFGVVTDASGGTQILQIDPSYLELVAGQEQLALFRLSPRGLYRWYAKCCDTPMFTTPPTAKIPIVGVVRANMDVAEADLGPVKFRYKMEQASGPVEGTAGSMVGFLAKSLKNIGGALMSGRWKRSPLFDAATGRAVRAPEVISLEEKAAAYQRQ